MHIPAQGCVGPDLSQEWLKSVANEVFAFVALSLSLSLSLYKHYLDLCSAVL